MNSLWCSGWEEKCKKVKGCYLSTDEGIEKWVKNGHTKKGIACGMFNYPCQKEVQLVDKFLFFMKRAIKNSKK
jgi:hypothetical protein